MYSSGAGKDRMAALETVHFHQDPQGTVGLEKVVVGIRGRMIGFTGITPGTIGLLLADQPARLGQIPERLGWPNQESPEVALDKLGQCRILPGKQGQAEDQWAGWSSKIFDICPSGI